MADSTACGEEPVGEDDVAAVAARMDQLAETGTDPIDRFADFVRSTFLTTLERNAQGATGGLIVFVLSEDPRADRQRAGWTRASLIDKGLQDLSGRIFLTPETLSGGVRIDHHESDLDQVIAAVESHGFGNRPAVLILPEHWRMFVFRHGVEDDEYLEIPLGDRQELISVEVLDQELDAFYEVNVRYPAQQHETSRYWAHAPKYVPVADTEGEFQRDLKMYLRGRLQNALVREETKIRSGRSDLSIYPRAGNGGCLAVMELKVFRARHSNEDPSKATSVSENANKAWATEGLNQAITFKNDLPAEIAFVCFFDMRMKDDDSILDHCRDRASDHGVHLRRYFAYNNHSAGRAAETATLAS